MLFPKKRLVESRNELINEFRKYIKEENATLIIIDNMTAISLRGEEADFAGKLMINLKNLLDEFAGLSIIVIAHTPKGMIGKPLTLDALAGSANYANLADSVVAIGKATIDRNQRYIIQLKSRDYEIDFHKDNVIQVEFKELVNGFKGYSFIGYESEEKMLRPYEASDKTREKESIIKILNNENVSGREIGRRLYNDFGKGRVSLESYERNIANKVKSIKAEGLVKKKPAPEVSPVDKAPEATPIENIEAAKPDDSDHEPKPMQVILETTPIVRVAEEKPEKTSELTTENKPSESTPIDKPPESTFANNDIDDLTGNEDYLKELHEEYLEIQASGVVSNDDYSDIPF
jgi:hypothetical protein